jgi:type 1 glutamine amidotransferase
MKILIFIPFIAIITFSNSLLSAQKRTLIITGGHDFEQKQYYEMFDAFEGLEYDTISQPWGNELFLKKSIQEYSCIVFYDMFQDITEAQKEAYLKLLNDGIGMVFTHHALVSYQNWPEFEKIIGGKYHLEASPKSPASSYRHDVDFTIEIVDKTHPVTKDMEDFEIHDEVYGSFTVGEHVNPLLKTKHPESTSIVGWCHQYKNSRIVYLQSGHDHHAYENKNYRMLLRRAIEWVSSHP